MVVIHKIVQMVILNKVPSTIELGGNITEDIVLTNIIDTPGVADYCVTGNIRLSALMTIEPGVELHFEPDTEFIVNGDEAVLIANGTADNHIVFTAKDSSRPWRGLAFISADDFRNTMNYVDISYAGADIVSIVDRQSGLGISSFSALSITNCSITNSVEVGMYVDSNVDLNDFANNRFENNGEAPLVIPAALIGQLDTASQFGVSNGEDMIEIINGNVDLDDPAFWKPMDDGTQFYITDNLDINSEVNIMPGVHLNFGVDLSMIVDGVLIANGTETDPIVFTARDIALPWRGISINSDSAQNIINFAQISYAGADTISNLDEKVALGINSFDQLIFTNSVISNSVNNGMLVEQSSDLAGFENNRFENNAITPLIISAESVHQLDTASQFGTTNGNNYIEVLGTIVDFDDDEITWKTFTDNTPYFLSSDLLFRSGVNITPNFTMMIGSNLSIRVDGGFLSAKGGTDEGRITLTAFDPLLPWKGISFLTDDIRNELDFVEVSYAGSDQLGSIDQIANIGVGGFDQLTVTNTIVSNGLGYGISVSSSAEVNTDIETQNSFIENTLGAIFYDE